MELQLKHLAGYLPYKLKLIDDKPKVMNAFCGHSTNWCSIEYAIKMQRKPILRPLSDLTKEIEVNREKFVPYKKLGWVLYRNECGIGSELSFGDAHSGTVNVIDYLDDLEKLYEWHFDIHGLIEKGLAIDINTISAE